MLTSCIKESFCFSVYCNVTSNALVSFKEEDNFGTFIDGGERFESQRFV